MKTNYSSISIKNFEKTVREYASFVVKLGKANPSNTAPKMQKINKNLNISNWKYFELGTLFKIESTKGNNTNNLIEGGARRCVYSCKKRIKRIRIYVVA